jgi:predicted TIM-barrel fold metal-dependent hydrolase
MKKIAIEEHWETEGLEHAKERIEDMDEAGIDMQVLSATLFYRENLDAAEGLRWARSTNDAFAGIIEKYPERFRSFAAVSLLDPASAAKELERAVTKLGFKGAMTGSEFRGEYLDHQKYWVLLEMAEKLDVPIYIHPAVPSPDMAKIYLPYPILSRSMWGFSADTGLHAMRLICGGIFDRFPRLKIILGHLGEGIPYWLWRLDRRWQKEKDGMEGLLEADAIASQLKKRPSQYFKENFYVATSGMFWYPPVQLCCSALGVERVLFAVDYPMESNNEAVKAIETMPISEHEKEQIFHLNAEKLLKL